MRYTLMLALVSVCLWAASAAADPLTKRNNDASLRRPHLRTPPIYRPSRPILEPIRQDLEPTK